MTVHCPHCLTGYLLPEHLLGGEGARVRCPGCDGVFVVLPEGETAGGTPDADTVAGPVIVKATSDATSGGGAEAAGAGGATRAMPTSASRAPAASVPSTAAGGSAPASPTTEPAVVAGEVLDVLADFLGEALMRSRARGTVLSDHGPAIIAVWDEYRRRAGAEAPSTVFRAALRDRCGVDLSHVNGG